MMTRQSVSDAAADVVDPLLGWGIALALVDVFLLGLLNVARDPGPLFGPLLLTVSLVSMLGLADALALGVALLLAHIDWHRA